MKSKFVALKLRKVDIYLQETEKRGCGIKPPNMIQSPKIKELQIELQTELASLTKVSKLHSFKVGAQRASN